MMLVAVGALLSILHSSLCAEKLEMVSMVFRHGDRSPVGTFPNDSYQESFWPQGFGQLTQTGMKQHYNLGKYLRHRYMTVGSRTYLLNGTYSRAEVSIRSTDVDRTLMSVESQMAAFYRPVGRQMFLKNFSWQPVPVHTVPVLEDSLLRAYGMDCPRYYQLKEKKKQDDDWIQLMKRNQKVLESVETHSGIQYKLDPYTIYGVSDPLFCELQHHLRWPNWCTNETFEILSNISSFGIVKMFEGTEINKLTSGVFINRVLTDMLQKRDGKGDNANKKLLVYSAHDTTVAAVLSGLGVYDNETPPYASIVMIELYSQDGKYYVEVSYHKGPSADISKPPRLLTIPNCDSSCPLDHFAQLMAPVLLREDEFQRECNVSTEINVSTKSSSSSKSLSQGMVAGLAILGVVVAIAVIGVGFWCSRRRRSKMRGRGRFMAMKDEEDSN